MQEPDLDAKIKEQSTYLVSVHFEDMNARTLDLPRAAPARVVAVQAGLGRDSRALATLESLFRRGPMLP